MRFLIATSRRIACSLVVLALLPSAGGRASGAGMAPGGHAALTSGHRECPPASVTQVVAEVNAARHHAGAPPLAQDTRLARIARGRAAAMATAGRLSHRGWERALRDGGVEGHVLGENVAYNYANASAVMRGWLASRGHRANILSPTFRMIGVGCVIDASGRWWWTQDFEG